VRFQTPATNKEKEKEKEKEKKENLSPLTMLLSSPLPQPE